MGRTATRTTPTLDQLGIDLTEASRAGKLDPVIGRTKEIARVVQILSRRTKNNPVLIGPPGVGKTMLARRAAGLLPALRGDEALEVTKLHSLRGRRPPSSLWRRPPVRMPHHTVSSAGLLGGGTPARPGEVSLAHCGLLFLDELPEFQPQVLDALRQPLESGESVIVRANHRVSYPSRIQLVAAMNPCRCGHLDDPDLACSRAPRCALDYQAKISGPLFDRIDLSIDVPAVRARTGRVTGRGVVVVRVTGNSVADGGPGDGRARPGLRRSRGRGNGNDTRGDGLPDRERGGAGLARDRSHALGVADEGTRLRQSETSPFG